MDGFGFTDRNSSARKKRSDVRRRPHSQPFPEPNDISSFSSRVPPDNDLIKNEHGRSEESDESSLNDSLQGSNGERYSRVYSNRHSNIIMTPTKWKDITKVGNVGNVVYASDGLEKDNKVKKVKLKVGGVTHTIHANSTPDGNSTVGSISPNSSNVSNFHRTRQKLLIQHNSDDKCSFNFDKRTGLRLEDSSKSGYSFVKGDHSWGPEKNIFMKQSDICEPTRKSKRISKRRPVHEAPDDEYDQDGETQYLEKAATVLRSGKQRRELRLARALEDTDYIEELFSDDEPEFKRKKMRKDLVDSKKDNKKEMTITTRQRALQIGKGSSSAFGASVMEFPDGLPPPPPRKQKEKLSDVELQLKKAEAAQTRRMQNEKAARESQAEAIRKVLGQDSSRKKREDKLKKIQEELAQERAVASIKLASDNVRWVMGPSGTVVTFPDEMGLPSIFDSRPCSYPPPREKCARTSCTNPYKYRDAKTNVPLCSLQCYKAIHEQDFRGRRLSALSRFRDVFRMGMPLKMAIA